MQEGGWSAGRTLRVHGGDCARNGIKPEQVSQRQSDDAWDGGCGTRASFADTMVSDSYWLPSVWRNMNQRETGTCGRVAIYEKPVQQGRRWPRLRIGSMLSLVGGSALLQPVLVVLEDIRNSPKTISYPSRILIVTRVAPRLPDQKEILQLDKLGCQAGSLPITAFQNWQVGNQLKGRKQILWSRLSFRLVRWINVSDYHRLLAAPQPTAIFPMWSIKTRNNAVVRSRST